MQRDYVAEARALPDFKFDSLMHEYFMRCFKPWIAGVSALELGCFHGDMTARIFKEYPDTCVVEGSAECIEIARAKAGLNLVEFIHATFETVVLDSKFDAIFLTHVLEHLDDPIAVLKRCRGWLHPGGKLFVAVPNAHAASRQIACKMGIVGEPTSVTQAEAVHGHRRTYSKWTFEKDLLKAGLKIVSFGGVMFKPLANFQADLALKHGVIDQAFLDGCYELGKEYPDFCSSLFAICEGGR
jgi:2-polyprenyl-3-methyl-5-hydroxy-6-metoxy-1,4-benzoquinol methylase